MSDAKLFEEWIRKLDEGVIQGEFGYQPGEFTVHPDLWEPLYREGLTPRQAWRRALAARAEQRREESKTTRSRTQRG